MRAEGIILDFDGVLCDSSAVHKDAYKLALGSLNYCWCSEKEEKYEKIKNEKTSYKLKSFSEHQLIRREDVETLNKIKQEFTLTLITSLQIDKRVSRFLQKLKGNSKKIGIASDANKDTIVSYLKKNLILDIFDVIVSSADVLTKTKPNPAVYFEVLRLLNLQPLSTIAFEDSEQGFIAAKSAGIERVYLCDYNNLFSMLEKNCNF